MVASTFGNVASTQGLRLENLRQKEGRLMYHFTEGVFVLRTFSGEQGPQHVPIRKTDVGARAYCQYISNHGYYIPRQKGMTHKFALAFLLFCSIDNPRSRNTISGAM